MLDLLISVSRYIGFVGAEAEENEFVAYDNYSYIHVRDDWEEFRYFEDDGHKYLRDFMWNKILIWDTSNLEQF